MTMKISKSVRALMDAPYEHEVSRDVGGNSRVTLLHTKVRSLTVVRPTFDEAVFEALAQAERQWVVAKGAA